MGKSPNLPNFDPGEEITFKIIKITLYILAGFLEYSVCSYVWDTYIRQEEWTVIKCSTYVTYQYIINNGNKNYWLNLLNPKRIIRKIRASAIDSLWQFLVLGGRLILVLFCVQITIIYLL